MKKYILLITLLYLPFATQCMDTRHEVIIQSSSNHNNNKATDCILDTLYLGWGFTSAWAILAASTPLSDPHASIQESLGGAGMQGIGLGGLWASSHRLANRGYFDPINNCLNYFINCLDSSDSHSD